MSQDRKVSVVVPTMNRPDDLKAFLATLVAQTRRPDELVVVDAGDSVEDVIREAIADTAIEFVYVESRPGTSFQRNRGVEASTGDVLFFQDDDMLLHPAYIERCLECFDLDYDPPVGGVLGTMTNQDEAGGLLGRALRVFWLTHAARGEDPAVLPSGNIRWAAHPSQIVPTPVASSGRVAYLRECIEAEPYRDYLPGYTHGEDVEQSLRVSRRWTILQTPFALTEHKISPVSRVSLGNRSGRAVYGHYYRFKHHMPHDPLHVAAYTWSQLGRSLVSLAQGVKHGNVGGVAKGLLWGYRLSVRDLMQDKLGLPPDQDASRE